MTLKLVDLAHCRAGDKGNDSMLVLIPYELENYGRLVTVLTRSDLAEHFSMSDETAIDIVTVPALAALVITVRGRLSGGVTRSSSVDPHGKTLSFHLLDMTVEW